MGHPTHVDEANFQFPKPHVQLCAKSTRDGSCRKKQGHAGTHSAFPTLWNGFEYDPDDKTRKKIVKAGFATPRGGAKGGYQNHVSRSSRVILPFEHALKVNFANYEQGYVLRVTVPQATTLLAENRLISRDERLFVSIDGALHQAFVLYRSQGDFSALPPLEDWFACEHRIDGQVSIRRAEAGSDYGHFLARVPRGTPQGIQQGIFAPEYATREENFACQTLLTYLAYQTEGYPSDSNLEHVLAVLADLGLYEPMDWINKGIVDPKGTTSCPLCNRRIANPELHETIDPSLIPGLANSGVQLEETRSTLVNLYHLRPLLYDVVLGHTARNIAWGHAHCNTLLSQRRSYTVRELWADGGRPDVELRWSEDQQFIRSEDGRAWVSVTPVPPGTSSFTEYLSDEGIDAALAEEDELD